jgi:serine/threonine protein kinase
VAERIDVGSELGGYQVTRRIGEGGMGAVFLAEEGDTGRQVALKVLLSELAQNEDFTSRFERESRYASSLDHPNIVRVHEFGEAHGVAYMVMDYVPGSDLAAELAGGPLSPERTMLILEQVASALDAVHATGLYHRDVKPANILVAVDEESGELRSRLTDFGLSKRPSQDSKALTSAGFFVGTSQYVAPEQILAQEVDHRVDIYSLGCLLYECLTGEPPFRRPREEQTLYAHMQDPPPKVTAVMPEFPAAIDDVVAKALAKQPEERYDSCGELVDAAREALASAGPIEPADPMEPAGPMEPADPMEPVDPIAPAVTGPGSPRLRLRVTAGNAQGTEIQVEDELLIGREAPDEGKLGQDAEISRQHARISHAGDEYAIEDLGSTNGTFLNGRQISRPEVLSPGDRIQVGATTLVVQVSVPSPSEAASAPDADTRSSEHIPTPELPTAEPEPVAALPPPLSLHLQFDPASGEITLDLGDDADPVRLVNEDGRWRLAPE